MEQIILMGDFNTKTEVILGKKQRFNKNISNENRERMVDCTTNEIRINNTFFNLEFNIRIHFKIREDKNQ